MSKSRVASFKTKRSRNASRPRGQAAPPVVPSRGRPRQFDRQAALEQAMRLFWQLGYEGTSMAELRAALGITQASLYAAFGSKEQLFREAVGLYRSTAGTTTRQALAEQPTARQSIRAMLESAAVAFTTRGVPSGCLLVLGTMNCAPASRPVQQWLSAYRLQTPRAIADRLRRGQAEGDVPRDAPVSAISAYYTTVLHGLSIQARDGASRHSLLQAAHCAMAAWDPLITGRGLPA